MGYRRFRTFDDYARIGALLFMWIWGLFSIGVIGLLLFDGTMSLVAEHGLFLAVLISLGYVVGAVVVIGILAFLIPLIMSGLGWLLSWIIDIPRWARRWKYMRFGRDGVVVRGDKG